MEINLTQVEVTLGTRTFTIQPPTFRKGEAWRADLQKRIGGILDLIGGNVQIEIDNVDDLMKIVNEARSVIFSLMSDVFELVVSFNSELTEEREYIADNAYDEQLVLVLFEEMKLAFPFGSKIVEMFSENGFLTQLTDLSSQEQPGESTTPTSTPSP